MIQTLDRVFWSSFDSGNGGGVMNGASLVSQL